MSFCSNLQHFMCLKALLYGASRHIATTFFYIYKKMKIIPTYVYTLYTLYTLSTSFTLCIPFLHCVFYTVYILHFYFFLDCISTVYIVVYLLYIRGFRINLPSIHIREFPI
ncbi:hypothetical protein BDB01DRAFT_770363, partial [Pilobolus umbonatus]